MKDKNQVKSEIKLLIQKYENAIKEHLVSRYTEEETKKDFISPLFEILGWTMNDKKEVTAEESQSSGRLDYGFYLDEKPKFFLEAKSLKTDLNKEEFANQAVRYSWNKGVTWAVLTDFESIKVFNAQDIESSLLNKLFFEINYTEYLNRFDQLYLLSKESFEENLLDKEAEKYGKKLQKVSVTSLLYKDLDKCREILTHDLSQWNSNVDKDLLDEGVQKLLDRLIFLRVAEDRNIESPILIPLIREWNSKGRKGSLYQSMVKKFRELDEIYDSNLFSKHPFEEWEEYSDATEAVINILYGKRGYYEYDFQAMPADVLGSIYENYLGYRLKKSKKGLSVSKDAKKRKEHGIYYTPEFIVDYIVKNTLKPVLDKCKNVNDLKKIKVLDPACGSGSFLIKALEIIYDKYKDFGNPGGTFTKINILLENIYGVDLDPQAIEIARLNLLISALDKRMKLPGLDRNIRNGNSLISGTDEELTKYFGKTFRDKKPFNWQEEFPAVFKQGGFDVIIGNPPYVQLSPESGYRDGLKNYLLNSFKSSMGRLNTFGFFFKRGIELLVDQGHLGFIIPNTILSQDYYKELRKGILGTCKVNDIVLYGDLPFKDAVVENVTLILTKTPSPQLRSNNKVSIHKVNDGLQLEFIKTITQDTFYKSSNFNLNVNIDEKSSVLKSKIEHKTIPLSEFMNINQAIALKQDRNNWVSNKKIDSNYKALLVGGKNINRYSINWDGTFLNYNLKGIHSGADQEKFLAKEKIFFRRVADHLIGALDTNKLYGLHTLVVMTPKRSTKLNIRYFLALFNSKLLSFYYKMVFASNKKVFSEIGARQVAQLPIKQPNIYLKEDKKRYEFLVNLAQDVCDMNIELQNYEENSEKWNSTKSEIEKTDKKIDEEVYKLYNLTPEEIAIVENSN